MKGKVVKVDYITELSSMGKYARVAFNLDLLKPLVSRIEVDGRIQLVEYESLPNICFWCGLFGHLVDGCKKGESQDVIDT